MNKLSRLYLEVYSARQARDAARGTPEFWIANAREGCSLLPFVPLLASGLSRDSRFRFRLHSCTGLVGVDRRSRGTLPALTLTTNPASAPLTLTGFGACGVETLARNLQ